MKQDKHFHHQHHTDLTRRTLMQSLAGAGMVAGLPLLPIVPAQAANKKDNHILVVLELSGANDGLTESYPIAINVPSFKRVMSINIRTGN